MRSLSTSKFRPGNFHNGMLVIAIATGATLLSMYFGIYFPECGYVSSGALPIPKSFASHILSSMLGGRFSISMLELDQFRLSLFSYITIASLAWYFLQDTDKRAVKIHYQLLILFFAMMMLNFYWFVYYCPYGVQYRGGTLVLTHWPPKPPHYSLTGSKFYDIPAIRYFYWDLLLLFTACAALSLNRWTSSFISSLIFHISFFFWIFWRSFPVA